VDDNLYALVISGHPSQEQLQLAWAGIQQEYADVMGDNEHKMYVILYRDIQVLKTTLQLIHWLVAQMKEVYYVEFAKRLNQLLHTTFKFDYTQPEKYFNQLNRCINRSKAHKIDLDLKLQQFEALKKNKEKGSQPTREYYQSLLITISDHAKYPVQDSITVYEFSERIRRFNNYCQQVEKMKR
jgi:hypothetical protein